MPKSRPRRTARGQQRIAKKQGGASVVLREAVLYARVSSREQERGGFSIPAQQELLRKYANDHGYVVVEEFVDVETAKRTGRTSFTKMLAFLRKRKPHPPAILVEKTDRLYRNLKDWVSLDDMKVDIHLVKENIVLSDDSRSSEKFVHGIKVLMAKNYVDNLSEEVRKGQTHKAREGHWPSSAPIGYLNRREGGKSYIVPDPERALLIRNLFETYDGGDVSLKDLAVHASKIGLRAARGGKLAAATVHIILRNPIYAGEFWWGGTLYQGKDPRLVTRELYDRVQARLDGHPYTRPQELTFAFTGMITCGLCGKSFTAELKKGVYVYYRCAQSCRRGVKYTPEKKLLPLIHQEVAKLRWPDSVRQAVITALKDSRRLIEQETRERIAQANERIIRIGRLLDKAYVDKLEGRIDEGFFAERRLEWEQERIEAARDVERLTRASARHLEAGIQVFELANSAFDLLSRRSALEQRDLLKTLFSNFTITEGELSVTWRKPFDLIAQSPSFPNEDGGNSVEQNRRHQEWSGWSDSN